MKQMRTVWSAGILLLSVLLMIGAASASTPGGADVAAGSNTTASTPASSGTSGAAGGYVTEINVSTNNQQTSYWQGFFGNVTGGTIYLNDSAGNTMKSWSGVLNNGGNVYATTKPTAPTWSGVTSITAATLDGAGYWNFGAKSDNITKTYTTTGSVTVAGTTVGSAITTAVGNYNDFAVSETSSPADRTNVIWLGVINKGATNFKGTTSDYELLVPVIAGDTYSFYLEIT